MSRARIRILASIFVLFCAYAFAQISNSQESKNALSLSVASPSPEALSAVVSADSAREVGYKVTKVIDGDTIQIEGGYKIRYIGVDAPETVDPKRPVGCFGSQASDKNKELVLGKNVILEKDVSETDKFGRFLRYVYIANSETGSEPIFVNDYLVRTGYARVSTYPPDVRYQEKFLESEKYARENNLGLWSQCF